MPAQYPCEATAATEFADRWNAQQKNSRPRAAQDRESVGIRRGGLERGFSDGSPTLWRAWLRVRLNHVDDPLRQALLAQNNDVELAGRGDLLQDFLLTQAHERRVVLQQLRRVRLAADRGHFLATHVV